MPLKWFCISVCWHARKLAEPLQENIVKFMTTITLKIVLVAEAQPNAWLLLWMSKLFLYIFIANGTLNTLWCLPKIRKCTPVSWKLKKITLLVTATTTITASYLEQHLRNLNQTFISSHLTSETRLFGEMCTFKPWEERSFWQPQHDAFQSTACLKSSFYVDSHQHRMSHLYTVWIDAVVFHPDMKWKNEWINGGKRIRLWMKV